MSYRDNIEALTGVPIGHTAFTSVAHRPPAKRSHAGKKRTKREWALSALESPEEKAAKRIALKNVSSFNVQIASPDDSRKTQSIARIK